VKETRAVSMFVDLVQLFKRARRACEEAQRLFDDQRFIISWSQMRPRSTVRLSPMVDE
jgi:hypothetical protein